MVEDKQEESLCGALSEMQVIFEQKGEKKFALGLIKKKMEKCGMAAREAADSLIVDFDLDSEIVDECMKILETGEDVDA